MLVVLQIESKVDFLMYSESIVVFTIPLLVAIHLFVDLLLFIPMNVTLMWFISAIIITNLMWSEFAPLVATIMLDQYDPPVFLQFCVPPFVSTFLFL